MSEPKKLSTEAYKGVRDFYPEDMFVQKYMFEVMRKTVESFGYAEYNASVLEPAELYRSKSSDEIVNEQTYTFTDRGEREVTLRPEMTPTVARMIAGKRREISFPARWYSIQNFFRYEKPQRGRLREFWQLNVDMFGAKGIDADVEIISLAAQIMKKFGAKDSDFEIKINNRGTIAEALKKSGLTEEADVAAYLSLVDKFKKIGKEQFEKDVVARFGKNIEYSTSGAGEYTEKVIAALATQGITNVSYDPYTVRGFGYYTGVVFEVFDTNPENRRALFGGGRFDGLTQLFDNEPIPAVGFGMGDVTMRDFLEVRGLLPTHISPAHLFIATTDEAKISAAQTLAHLLRAKGVAVSVNLTDKKIGDQIKSADKQKIPFVLVLGDDEIANKIYKVKNLATGTETSIGEDQLAELLGSIV